MTWTIWINFLPLSHGGSTLNLASVGPVVSEKIFENTHTHTFFATRTQQRRVVPDEQYGVGGGGFQGKALYFCGGGGGGEAVFFLFFFSFLFQSSGQLAFVKMYNFLQVMVLLKNAVCSNGICWNEKKFLFLEEGSPEKKKKLCECHGGGVDW